MSCLFLNPCGGASAALCLNAAAAEISCTSQAGAALQVKRCTVSHIQPRLAWAAIAAAIVETILIRKHGCMRFPLTPVQFCVCLILWRTRSFLSWLHQLYFKCVLFSKHSLSGIPFKCVFKCIYVIPQPSWPSCLTWKLWWTWCPLEHCWLTRWLLSVCWFSGWCVSFKSPTNWPLEDFFFFLATLRNSFSSRFLQRPQAWLHSLLLVM